MNHAAAAADDPALPAVLAALRARGIQVHPEWPAQCLEFVRASTVPPPVRHADLERLVLDQYLLADLRHVAVPALPPHAASFDHTNLVIRNTVLQIMAIDEVGESTLRVVDALEALLAYNKAAAIGQPPPPPNARGRGGGRARARATAPTIPRTMLKLYLTDGHTDLVGMEYQPMPFLSLLMPLGAKIRVENARCSRGVLFLTPETTQLLGGEVEELKITMPDLIARLKAKIGLREHPNAARAPPGPVDRMANQFLIDPPDMADMEDPDEAPLPIATLADAQNDHDDGAGPPPPPAWPADPVAVPTRVKRASIGGSDARPPPVKRPKVDLTLSPPTSSMSAPTTAPVQTLPVAQPERVAFRCTAIGQTGLHIRPNPHNKKQVQAIIPLIVAPTGEVLYAIGNEPVLGKFVDLAAWRATRDQAHFMPLKQGLVPALVEHMVYLTRVPDPGGVAFQTKALTGRAEWELVAWE
ncbi:recQ-mediated genome instability protein 1 [Allomyces arbusculus]|nr:recQ-mediated genome instability protein 1 [Allomyces arbusculus]